MMMRPKARRRPWLMISSVSIVTLALLAGAVFFLLPKVIAANANTPTNVMGSTSNSAQTLNSTGNTNTANKASNTNTTSNTNAGQVTAQPTQPAPATTTQGSNTTTTGNGANTQPAPTTGANTANQTVPQTTTVPVVMLKQYVPDIRHMVAQKFNMTDKALALLLQSGMHLKDIATLHGISNTQLQSLLSTSITTGFQPAISAGSLTQMQVSTFIQQAQVNPTTLEQQLSILPAPVAHW